MGHLPFFLQHGVGRDCNSPFALEPRRPSCGMDLDEQEFYCGDDSEIGLETMEGSKTRGPS